MSDLILITGAAGYIGSHCALALLEKGFKLVIVDNLSTGHIETIETLKKYGSIKFYNKDLINLLTLDEVFKENKIEAVFHFAAYSQVAESVKNPKKYYENNIIGTLNLLSKMLEYDIKKFIFSSTAATYGEPKYTPIDENHPQEPVNPYGRTKLFIEKILDDYDKAYGLKSVRLRYFNAAGADSKTRIGEWHNPETHLIPNILKSVFEKGKTFELYGDNYNTKDGTCERDYINIEDLINAHILAYEYLSNGAKTNFFNLGLSKGITVREVFESCEKITNKKIPLKIMPKREGDPMRLVADNSKAQKILNWKPQNNLEKSIKTAYEWEKKLQGKEL